MQNNALKENIIMKILSFYELIKFEKFYYFEFVSRVEIDGIMDGCRHICLLFYYIMLIS